MHHKNLSYRSGELSYCVMGAGDPIMLLHGFAEDSTIWNKLIGYLPEHKIFLIDIPGTGSSTMLPGEEIKIDHYAQAIKAIAEAEDLNSFTLIGHSMGGYIALAFAEKYPELLRSLVLFHSSAFADTRDKIATRKKSVEFITNNGSSVFLKTTIPSLFSEKYKEQHADVIDDLIKRSEQFTPEVLIQYYQAMINKPDRTAVLKTFNKPVLFIMGEKDNAVPLEASLKQCHLPIVSHVHILPEAAHMGMLEATEECASFVSSFLSYPSTPKM
ncbi:alpha/beta hydrolase [soil metagenome]